MQWTAYDRNQLFTSERNPAEFLHEGDKYYFTSGEPFQPKGKTLKIFRVHLQMPQMKKAA
jgi:hypothetical protein